MDNLYGGTINTGRFYYGRRERGKLRACLRGVAYEMFREPPEPTGRIIATGAQGVLSCEAFKWWTELPSNVWLRVYPYGVYEELGGTGRWETGSWKNYRERGSNDEVHPISYRYVLEVLFGYEILTDVFVMFSPPMPYRWYTYYEPPFMDYEGYDVAVDVGETVVLEWEIDIARMLTANRLLDIEIGNIGSDHYPPGCAADGVRILKATESAVGDGYEYVISRGQATPINYNIDLKGQRFMDGNTPIFFPDRAVCIDKLLDMGSVTERFFDFVVIDTDSADYGYNDLGDMYTLVEDIEIGSAGAMFNIPLEIDETFEHNVAPQREGIPEELAHYRVQIADSKITLSVDHGPNTASGYRPYYWLYIDYDVFPATVRYVGDFRYFDGSVPDITPQFSDGTGTYTWSGTDSGVVSYYGEGLVSASYGQHYLYQNLEFARWEITGGTPQMLRVKLLNPEEFDIPVDDIRVQILYSPPSGREQVRTTSKLYLPVEFVIVDWTDAEEAGEWVAVGCTVQVAPDGLRVVASSSDAYIYRDYPQPPFDPDDYQLRHAPAYRYWQLVVDCDDELKRELILIHGRPNGPERRQFAPLYAADLWGGMPVYDTCAPHDDSPLANRTLYDNTQSYFETFPALLSYNREDPAEQERVVTSIFWGIGRLTRLTLRGFRQGVQYTLKQLKGLAFSAHFVTQKGYNDWHYSGMFITYDQSGYPHRHELYEYRGPMLIVDGRVGYECTLAERHVIDELFTLWGVTRLPMTLSRFVYNVGEGEQRTGLNRFPWDDFQVIAHDVLIPYDPAWEHWYTNEEPWHYTGDDILYCWDKCLTWFVVSDAHYTGPPGGSQFVYEVKTVPMCDYWSPCCHLSVGTSPTDFLTVPFTFRCRGRAFGIVQPEELPPIEAYERGLAPRAYERLLVTDKGDDVESPESVQTDQHGSWTTGQHTTRSTFAIWPRGELKKPLGPASRLWYRLVLRQYLEQLPRLRMRHSKATKDLPDGFVMTDATGRE